jgi:signal transduction histidine kinase
MPQLICLVDGKGRVMHANRTLERWGLGKVEAVRGIELHELLHGDCGDRHCYLRPHWQQTLGALAQERRAERDVWDPVLGRHLAIRTQMPVAGEAGAGEDFYAVVIVDDVTELKASEKRSRIAGGDLGEWVRTEEALRTTQNQLWRLSAQHLSIQESERRRIAVDLHDGLGQTLSLVKLSIEEAARSVAAEASSKVAAALERLGPTVKSALAELRRISMNLRPSTLDDLGILATLSWYFREFESACPNVKLERDIGVAEADVPQSLRISIFRIVQEATNNALKHARAERIRVCLRSAGGALELTIEDDGRGFDPQAAATQSDFSHGLGLQSMRERAELSGGSYEIDSLPGKGTRIRVGWPSPEQLTRDWAAIPEVYTNASVHKIIPVDRRLPEKYSQCLACMRSLRS